LFGNLIIFSKVK